MTNILAFHGTIFASKAPFRLSRYHICLLCYTLPSTAHIRLLRHTVTFNDNQSLIWHISVCHGLHSSSRVNICLLWYTFALRWHRTNKSSTALIAKKRLYSGVYFHILPIIMKNSKISYIGTDSKKFRVMTVTR